MKKWKRFLTRFICFPIFQEKCCCMKMSRDKLHLLELSGFEREQLARIPDSYIVTCADRTSVSAAMVKEADVIIGRVPVELLGYARKSAVAAAGLCWQ